MKVGLIALLLIGIPSLASADRFKVGDEVLLQCQDAMIFETCFVWGKIIDKVNGEYLVNNSFDYYGDQYISESKLRPFNVTETLSYRSVFEGLSGKAPHLYRVGEVVMAQYGGNKKATISTLTSDGLVQTDTSGGVFFSISRITPIADQ
jgi:hypothetical protein